MLKEPIEIEYVDVEFVWLGKRLNNLCTTANMIHKICQRKMWNFESICDVKFDLIFFLVIQIFKNEVN